MYQRIDEVPMRMIYCSRPKTLNLAVPASQPLNSPASSNLSKLGCFGVAALFKFCALALLNARFWAKSGITGLAFFLSCCASLSCDPIPGRLQFFIASTDWQEELKQIDEEVEQLEDLKNRYRASETRHRDEASRWQFQNLKQESRRAYQQADLDREMQNQIQKRIDYLQTRREEILKEHPESNGIQKPS